MIGFSAPQQNGFQDASLFRRIRQNFVTELLRVIPVSTFHFCVEKTTVINVEIIDGDDNKLYFPLTFEGKERQTDEVATTKCKYLNTLKYMKIVKKQ